MTTLDHKAGFVAIFGAPNAGKSTLLNRILGEKVAITAAKPQTTRHRILGVISDPGAQLIFWDTPGYHSHRKPLNQEMVSRTLAALADSDVCLWLVDGRRQGQAHQETMGLVRALPEGKGLVIAVNKADAVGAEALAGLKAGLSEAFPGTRVLAVSAKTGKGVGILKKGLARLLPPGPALYPEDALTDQPMRLIAAEFVREAVFEATKEELPYSTAVTVDEYLEPGEGDGSPPPQSTYIAATIHVEKDNQKAIMIGKGGSMLQAIGTRARGNIERLVGGPVFLRLFVRVTKDWTKDRKSIRDFGYGDRP
jgi:GTP-binding protein Era